MLKSMDKFEKIRNSIRKLRQSLDLTQAQLAEKSDLSLGTIRQIELGIRKKPSSDSLFKIAKALGTTTDELLHGEEHSRVNETFRKHNNNFKITSPAHNEQKATPWPTEDIDTINLIASLIRRFAEVSHAERRVLLALIFEDPTLLQDGPEIEAALTHIETFFSKAR